jgi:hypothetical protein
MQKKDTRPKWDSAFMLFLAKKNSKREKSMAGDKIFSLDSAVPFPQAES